MIEQGSATLAPIVSSGAEPEKTALAWSRVQGRLRQVVGDEIFTSWFARLELDAIEGNTVRLSVPTRFLKSWLEQHYDKKLLAAVKAEFACIGAVTLRVRAAAKPVAPPAARAAPRFAAPATAPAPTPAAPQQLPEAPELYAYTSRPDPRLTFASFVVGGPNRLAHAAARNLLETVEHDGATPFNPLYLHGEVGVGKTHLLQAIAAFAPKVVVYVSAEKFLAAWRPFFLQRSPHALLAELKGVRAVAFDDIQFLIGRGSGGTLGRALDLLAESGRLAIAAADCAPSGIDVDERARARMIGGLCLMLEPPNIELRLGILAERIATTRRLHPDFSLAEGLCHRIAEATRTGREIDGAVNRLLVHHLAAAAQGQSGEITFELAERAIAELVGEKTLPPVKIEEIQRLVARELGIQRIDMLSSRRTANVVWPRQVAMYLAKTLTQRSLPEIGRRFGGRDHTTVLHAVRKVDGFVNNRPAVAEQVERLIRLLRASSGA